MAVIEHITNRPTWAAPLSLSRRLLTGALLGVGAAASTPGGRALARPPENDASTRSHPDQHLFNACSSCEALERHARLSNSKEARPAEQACLIKVISRDRAATLAGARRKAATVAFFAPDLLEPSRLWDRNLMASLLRDLMVIDRESAQPSEARS